MSKPERIVLTEQQSEHIRQSGVRFAIIHPGSYPATVGRWVVDLIPCDEGTAVKACEVALGRRHAGSLIRAPRGT